METRDWVGNEKTWRLRVYPHPGKYEGGYMVDEYVHGVALESGCDIDTGDEGFGWYGLLRHGHTIFQDHDPLRESLTEEEIDFLTSMVGVIVSEDSQGFAYFEYFEDMAELDEAWNKIEAEFEAWSAEVESDE